MSEIKGLRVQGLFGVKGVWVMTLHPDRLVLAPAKGTGLEVEIAREEIADAVTLREPALVGPCLIVKAEKRIGFRLNRRSSAAYAEWRGPLGVRDLRDALKRMATWGLPIGILFLLTSLPIPGDEPLPLDGVGLALGSGLLLIWILSRLVPTRWLFMADALWWAALATESTIRVLGGDSPWWMILAGAAVYFGVDQIRNFRRFPPDRELAVPSPQGTTDTDVT